MCNLREITQKLAFSSRFTFLLDCCTEEYGTKVRIVGSLSSGLFTYFPFMGQANIML
jgi:hypothetical protein